MKTNQSVSYDKKSQLNNKNIEIDLSPYYVYGLPILLFLALLASFSLALTAIYEYCF